MTSLRRHRVLRSVWPGLLVAGVVVAAAASLSAVRAWHSAEATAQTRSAYGALRAGAAHEASDLRKAYARPKDFAARRRLFGTTQSVTGLLVQLQGIAPASQEPVVRDLENAHSAVTWETSRALVRAPDRSRHLAAALGLFREIQAGAARAQSDARIANPAPWPSTTAQRIGAADLALLLILGIGVLLRRLVHALGLRRTDDEGNEEIERLTHVARSDSLTGLANHRAFQDDLRAAIDRRNADGTPFTLLAGDLDGLKQVNDVHGHGGGDVYIKTAAGCIRDEVGERGSVYRTGGDEFMALLPGCRGWHALTIAHNIQRSANHKTGKRALSIGIAESTTTEGRRALLHQADLALYEAKRAKLLAVSYHPGLEPRQVESSLLGPSQHQKALAAALAQAVDAKDAGTRNHSETVADLCAAMGARLGLSGEALERLRIAGLLHDVGKIGVSDAILGKRGALQPGEREEIELHTSVGHSILTSAELHREAVWVLHHHERFDGTGYPTGLAGEAIPLESRIIAVADAFEAMTGSRPYRQALTPEEALAELGANSGVQFDPVCVRALDELFGGGAEELATPAAPEVPAALSATA